MSKTDDRYVSVILLGPRRNTRQGRPVTHAHTWLRKSTSRSVVPPEWWAQRGCWTFLLPHTLTVGNVM